MKKLEKFIFEKLKSLCNKNDTRADLTIDEYSKIFSDPYVFIRQTTKDILSEIKKEVK